MKLNEIVDAVNGKILVLPRTSDVEVEIGFASDLMSDVLHLVHLVQARTLLITGLTNVQVIRTAEIAELPLVLFVRGKQPMEDTLTLARHLGIGVLLSPYTMYESCGLLYQAGLSGQAIV